MSQHEDELYELLQSKRASGEVQNNEGASTVGTTSLYDDPEDRVEGGEQHAPWGEEGPSEGKRPNQAFHNSSGVYDEHKKVRQGVLDNAFAGRKNTDAADQALISSNFAHGKSGDFTAHSVHLQSKSVEKVSHPRTPTLMERVAKIAGRI
jgi:hypothetical protein